MTKICSRDDGTPIELGSGYCSELKLIMRFICLFLPVVLLVGACQKPSVTASVTAKRFPFKGKVISVDRTAKKARIEHDAVAGYMDAMTMDFPIHADMAWDELKPGAELRAELVVDSAAKEPYFLDTLTIIAAPDSNRPALPINENFAQIGQPVPDFSFVNQDGKRISIKDFRGKALAITFIYAKCPLPDYCIRMSTNFSDLANQLASNAELKDKIRLLSISFDPANDTPDKLRSYGLGYLGHGAKPDFTIWQLAVGKDAEVRKIAEYFGLQYEVDNSDKTKINHSLITAVIDPDGKAAKILPGNEWTPADLLKGLGATLKGYQK